MATLASLLTGLVLNTASAKEVTVRNLSFQDGVVPITSTECHVTSGYGMRTIRGKRKMHGGIDCDVTGDADKTIYAPFTGWWCQYENSPSLGNYLIGRPIDLLPTDGEGNSYSIMLTLGHLDSYSEKAWDSRYHVTRTVADLKGKGVSFPGSRGDEAKRCSFVKKGSELGVMGDTGRSYGVHLHIQGRACRDLSSDYASCVKINPVHFYFAFEGARVGVEEFDDTSLLID